MVSSWSLDDDETPKGKHLSLSLSPSTAGAVSFTTLQFLMMVTREVHFLMGSLPSVLGLAALKANRSPPPRGLALQATLLHLHGQQASGRVWPMGDE